MSAPHTPVGMYYTKSGIGEGLFDQLMGAMEGHLDNQFKKQRLTGADYARVYVGSLEAVLSNTTQYLLGNLLIDEQRQKILKEIELTDKQIDQIDKEIEKTDAEIEVLKLQPILTAAQIDKINAEIAFLEAQKDMMDAQKLKIDKEIEFLTAKIRTEYANTISSYADPNSLVGRQKSLLEAQKLGFAGDLQSKMAKMFADYDAVVESVNENGQAVLGQDAIRYIGFIKDTANDIKAIG